VEDGGTDPVLLLLLGDYYLPRKQSPPHVRNVSVKSSRICFDSRLEAQEVISEDVPEAGFNILGPVMNVHPTEALDIL